MLISAPAWPLGVSIKNSGAASSKQLAQHCPFSVFAMSFWSGLAMLFELASEALPWQGGSASSTVVGLESMSDLISMQHSDALTEVLAKNMNNNSETTIGCLWPFTCRICVVSCRIVNIDRKPVISSVTTLFYRRVKVNPFCVLRLVF